MEFTACDNHKCQEHIKFLHESISKMSVNNCNLEKDNIKLKEENKIAWQQERFNEVMNSHTIYEKENHLLKEENEKLKKIIRHTKRSMGHSVTDSDSDSD
tara:strand:- start:213 stop:512 length:300 start_codon:yes stop_codon:yes gene_type:complete